MKTSASYILSANKQKIPLHQRGLFFWRAVESVRSTMYAFFCQRSHCIITIPVHLRFCSRPNGCRRNAPVDGRPKAIQYVDPWGSVARTFQDKPAPNGRGPGSTNGSQMGVQSGTNGSQMGGQGVPHPHGSQTAQSSASA